MLPPKLDKHRKKKGIREAQKIREKYSAKLH